MTRYLIGVDVGSSDCKCMIIDTDGHIIASETLSYPTNYPHPTWAQQNPEDWYQAACQSIRTCIQVSEINPLNVLGIAIDGPAHNVALMDKKNCVIYPTIHWSDLRSVPQSKRLESELGDEIFALTYCRVNPAWTLAQLLWLKENEPSIYARLRRILVTKDYVCHRFTGQYQTDEYDAIGTQLYDVKAGKWSQDLLDILDLESSWLPSVAGATDISGKLTKNAARDTGLVEGIPVAVGSGDSVVEAASIGAIAPGTCIVKLGTAANVNLVTSQPLPTHGSITYRHVVNPYWFTITATNAGAFTMRWFRDTFCRHEVEQAEQNKQNVYELINQLAGASTSGARGILFHPYLRGERSPHWDPDLRGSFTGIHARHTIHDFARAVLEGVAFSIRDCLEIVHSLGQPIHQYFLIGGGSKSDLWGQVLCDVLGIDLIKPAVESAAYGSAMLAGISVGLFNGWDEAIAICSQSQIKLIPTESTRKLYDTYFNIYCDITHDLKQHNHRMSQLTQLLET